VNNEEDLSPELKEFIDRLIVPLLVDDFLRHLYSAGRSTYDDEVEAPAQAA
jgi:hypothetical protein